MGLKGKERADEIITEMSHIHFKKKCPQRGHGNLLVMKYGNNNNNDKNWKSAVN